MASELFRVSSLDALLAVDAFSPLASDCLGSECHCPDYAITCFYHQCNGERVGVGVLVLQGLLGAAPTLKER